MVNISWKFDEIQKIHLWLWPVEHQQPLCLSTEVGNGDDYIPSRSWVQALAALMIISLLWRSKGRTVEIILVIFFSSCSSLSSYSFCLEFCLEISSETAGGIFANKVSYEGSSWICRTSKWVFSAVFSSGQMPQSNFIDQRIFSTESTYFRSNPLYYYNIQQSTDIYLYRFWRWPTFSRWPPSDFLFCVP